MTRSDLLCHLMSSPAHRSVVWLNRIYGHLWEEPMRSLIDLELVMPTRNSNRGELRFDVIPWRGIRERAA